MPWEAQKNKVSKKSLKLKMFVEIITVVPKSFRLKYLRLGLFIFFDLSFSLVLFVFDFGSI